MEKNSRKLGRIATAGLGLATLVGSLQGCGFEKSYITMEERNEFDELSQEFVENYPLASSMYKEPQCRGGGVCLIPNRKEFINIINEISYESKELESISYDELKKALYESFIFDNLKRKETLDKICNSEPCNELDKDLFKGNLVYEVYKDLNNSKENDALTKKQRMDIAYIYYFKYHF